MRERLTAIAGPAAGLGFFVAMAVAMSFAPPSSAEPDGAPARIAQQLADHADGVEWAAKLTMLASLLLVVFGSYLSSRLSDGERRWRPAIALLPAIGATLMAAMLLVQAAFMMIIGSPDLYEHAPEAAHLVLALSWNYAFVFASPIAAIMLGVLVAAVDRHVLPRPLGALAALVFIMMLFVGAGLGAGLGMLWMLILAAYLLVHEIRSPTRSQYCEAGQTRGIYLRIRSRRDAPPTRRSSDGGRADAPVLACETALMEIATDRLRLVAADVDLAAAQVEGGEALASALGADLPDDWPPEYNDEATASWIHGKLAESPKQTGWWSWYVLLRRHGNDAPDLAVAIVGFKGPPKDGMVEVGYSVVESLHRKGIASEAVSRLTEWAFSQPDVQRVEAETLPHLTPSIGVVTKLGFASVDSGNPETIRFALHRQ